MDSSAATLAEEKEVGRSASPTPLGSINKEKFDGDDTATEKEENGSVRNATLADEGGEGEIEYPTGIRLTFIVVALVLSIFLVRPLKSSAQAQG
jgi:hypothetical protein